MRLLLAALALVLAATPLAAQHAGHDPDDQVAAGGHFPDGWLARVDRDQPVDQVRFTAVPGGYHAVMGPAAVFYDPAWQKSGNYSVSARFTQTKAPRHPEAYGIVIGGRDLAGPDQAYSYFLVRNTGEYFIATRKGDQRVKVVDWTPSPAIAQQDAAGREVNVLGATVRGNDVVFTVNGQEVARQPRDQVFTNGVFGFRINHNLDVLVDQVKQ